ncbi:hypothetical protein ACWA2B_16925 [Paenibacillus sp. CMM36]
MRQVGGDGHAVLKYITDDEFNHVKDHPLIKEIAYAKLLSNKVTNEEFIKHRAELWYYDDVGLKLGLIKLQKGSRKRSYHELQNSTIVGSSLEGGCTTDAAA